MNRTIEAPVEIHGPFPPRRRPYRSAFTLTELVIVLTVFVLLGLLLTPAIIGVLENRRRSDCLGNLRQIGRGFLAYASDFDDSLPMAYHDSHSTWQTAFSWKEGAGKATFTWADLISHYLPGSQIYSCPTDSTGPAHWPEGSSQLSPGLTNSYSMNAYFFVQPGVHRETMTGGGLSELSNLAMKLLVTENASAAGKLISTPADLQGKYGKIWQRHSGRSNWLWADGHISSNGVSSRFENVASKIWLDPKTAEKEPYPQWIPWSSFRSVRW